MVATCLASAIATFFMAFGANYPIALAPCMSENFFFVTVCLGSVLGFKVPWQIVLAAVFISGVLFLALSAFKFREALINSLPTPFKYAIPAGIGVFIAFIGLQQGGIVVAAPGSMVTLGKLTSAPVLLTFGGLILIAVLQVWRIKGAILYGLLATTFISIVTGLIHYHGIISMPPSIAPVFFKLNLRGVLHIAMLPVITIFLFMVLFDTVGTLTGVCQQAGLMNEKTGKVDRISKALFSDALGTTVGALLGSTTVSSYIESAAGVVEGAKTGLSAFVVGVLFLVSLFFFPLVQMVGGGMEVAGGMILHPITAPVMIIVGIMMARNIGHIAWDDPCEFIPAFLIVIGIPFCYSIAGGLVLGFIMYPILKLLSGKARQVPLLIYVMAIILAGVFIIGTK